MNQIVTENFERTSHCQLVNLNSSKNLLTTVCVPVPPCQINGQRAVNEQSGKRRNTNAACTTNPNRLLCSRQRVETAIWKPGKTATVGPLKSVKHLESEKVVVTQRQPVLNRKRSLIVWKKIIFCLFIK